jgi:hypothetical protein
MEATIGQYADYIHFHYKVENGQLIPTEEFGPWLVPEGSTHGSLLSIFGFDTVEAVRKASEVSS